MRRYLVHSLVRDTEGVSSGASIVEAVSEAEAVGFFVKWAMERGLKVENTPAVMVVDP